MRTVGGRVWLTCAEGEDDGSGAADGYETTGVGEDTVDRVEDSESERVEAFGLVAVAALGTL